MPAFAAPSPFCPCAPRELQEESGLTVDVLHKVGQIVFEFAGDPELMDVHIFRTDSVQGTPEESDGESQPGKSRRGSGATSLLRSGMQSQGLNTPYVEATALLIPHKSAGGLGGS